jgi:hypothetical protein
MNLTKLFNFQYLKQNLKKSKGLLTLLVLIVPVLTTLMLIAMNNSIYEYVIEEEALSIINIIGMYAIPVLISIILCGYVYKRNSVDFINSMPMNRKTIYFTNFVAGLLVILAIQVLTLITNLICANVLTDLFIPIGMVIDSFWMMLASYIFVYSATMVAMTLSGNILTQIVVTALIVFLVPFSHMTFVTLNDDYSSNITINYDGGSNTVDTINTYDYTMPFRAISSWLYSSVSGLFSIKSIVRMLVLSVIYLLLGMYLFEKRKMENVGTSFATLKAHYLVKALTMVPMVFLICLTEADGIYLVIALTLIFIYCVLYDFILNKKIKLRYTIPFFVVTVVLLCGIYFAGNYIVDMNKDKEISIDDIQSIAIATRDYSVTMEHNTALNNFIEDRDVINEVCKTMQDIYNYYFVEDAAYSSVNSSTEYTYEYNNLEYVFIRIKLDNGKDYYSSIKINKELLDKIQKEYPYTEKADYDEFAIATQYSLLPKEDAERIKEILEKTNYDLVNNSYSTSLYSSFYAYKNHALMDFSFDVARNQEIFDIVSSNLNNKAVETLEKVNGIDGLLNNSVNIYKYNYNAKDDSYDKDYIHNDLRLEMINYIKQHYQDKCDISKEFLVISIYGIDESYRAVEFCCNMTDELKNIIESQEYTWDSESDYEVDTEDYTDVVVDADTVTQIDY